MYLSNKNQADFSLPTNWSIEQLKPKALASFMKAGVGTKFVMTMVMVVDVVVMIIMMSCHFHPYVVIFVTLIS